jgi:hypothetical protein
VAAVAKSLEWTFHGGGAVLKSLVSDSHTEMLRNTLNPLKEPELY